MASQSQVVNHQFPDVGEKPIQQRQKFDAEFIERRMREHREWRHFKERALALGIIREVLALEATGDLIH